MYQFPDAARAEFEAVLKDFDPQLLAHVRAQVPVRRGPRQAEFRKGSKRPPGGLRSLLSTRIDQDAGGVRLAVGLLTPQARGDGFYGYILDAGRGLHGDRSRPRGRYLGQKAEGSAIGRYSARYDRRISPIPADRYDITFGRSRDWARAQVGPLLARVYRQTLVRIAWGSITGAA